MKKFEIIEDGRLSKSEMAEIKGGDMSCPVKYDLVQYCYPSGVSFATCHAGYKSCHDSVVVQVYYTCGNIQTPGYRGTPGPGGLQQAENGNCHAPAGFYYQQTATDR